MIKSLKSNKLISLLLVIICIFFIIKPNVCSSSCLNAISVWSLKVLPMLFPFFVLTRLLISLADFKPGFMDKFFNKVYNAPNGSFFVFLLSALAGYPMGAKLISTMYENGKISNKQAEKMLSFCSVSGPMFMIGTVGVAIFNSYKVGLIILISNILACLINGLIYRGKQEKPCINSPIYNHKSNNVLADAVYDSLISILMVGAYIVLSFIFIDVLKELNVLSFICNICSSIFRCDKSVVEGILISVVEITRGNIEINRASISLKMKTILASGVIGFGGISVFMQSLGFLKNLNIKPVKILVQKITQCLLCLVVTIFISIIFL